MRSVITIAFKDLTLMSRDWVGMFFIIGFPVIMGVFLGVITGSFGTENASLAIAVVDEDRSEMSGKFVQALDDNENVSVVELSRSDAVDHVRRGKLVGMVVLPDAFGETAGIMWQEGPAIQVGADPSRQAEAAMINGLVMKAMGTLIAARFQDPAAMVPFIEQARLELVESDEVSPAVRPLLLQMLVALESFTSAMETVRQQEGAARSMPEMEIARIESIDVTRAYEKGSAGDLMRKIRSKWDIAFPQAMLWGVLGCAAGFAITMVRERTQGTMLRLHVASVTRGQIFAGKALACFLAVVCVITLLIIIGVALGMRPKNPAMLVAATLCIAFCFVGVMMLMSVMGKTEEAVSGAAWFSNILMAMLGGGMIPLAFMPSFMKTLSHISPVKWSILALEGAIWRGFSFGEMLVPCAVLIAISVGCVALGIAVLSRANA